MYVSVYVQDSVDTLMRTQARGIENQLYNKANELQEDLSMKKFDLRAKQLQLSAVRAQVSLPPSHILLLCHYVLLLLFDFLKIYANPAPPVPNTHQLYGMKKKPI